MNDLGDRRGGRSYPAAFPEKIQGIDRDVNAGTIGRVLKVAADRPGIAAFLCQTDGVENGIVQSDRGTVIIRHQYLMGIIRG